MNLIRRFNFIHFQIRLKYRCRKPRSYFFGRHIQLYYFDIFRHVEFAYKESTYLVVQLCTVHLKLSFLPQNHWPHHSKLSFLRKKYQFQSKSSRGWSVFTLSTVVLHRSNKQRQSNHLNSIFPLSMLITHHKLRTFLFVIKHPVSCWVQIYKKDIDDLPTMSNHYRSWFTWNVQSEVSKSKKKFSTEKRHSSF